MRHTLSLFLIVLLAAACNDSPPARPGARPGAVLSVAPGGTLTGTVREQIPVGPYVYVRLETPGGEAWAAVNESPMTVGSSITVYNVMTMEKFDSPSLKRTFARIFFGTLDPSGGAVSAAPGNVDSDPASAHPAPAPATVSAPVGLMARASGANARTIGELWKQKTQLAGTTVSVRGVVVKYNASVMGKNWIHLQDGSGEAAQGSLDLTVTSADAATVGDTVTVTGTLRTNQDLGAGYTYAVLLENAKVARR